jgi:hypothetical protein
VGTYAGSFSGGSSQYLTVPSNAALAIGTVFTIEFWINPTTNSNGDILVSGVSGGFEIGYQNSSSWGIAASNTAWRLTSSTMPALNAWSHIAIVRTGTGTNQSAIYLNGTNVATGTIPDAWTTTAGLTIGAFYTGNTFFSGALSNIRIVKGTAVYTSNFAPPASPLAAITNTSLLTLQNATIIDNSSNAFTITNNNSVTTFAAMPFAQLSAPAVDYLVVAGGGAGGDNPNTTQGNGGGGGGGLLQGSIPTASGTSYTVTIGAGSGRFDANGGNSVFSSITATGGGTGARASAVPSYSGGSGGGGSTSGTASQINGAQGTFGQGNAGGNGYSPSPYTGAGGGGAGTIGFNGNSSTGGNGGAGIASVISGTVTTYAGGGGGSIASSGTGGTGGVGGGGNGGGSSNATNGTANTGGGGGAAASFNSSGLGGSGIVIVSYPDIYAGAASTTGSPTVSTSGAGSTYFSGTANQYLSASSSNMNLGTGDFTIEMWVYLTTLPGLTIWFSGGNDIYIQWNPSTNYLMYQNGTTAMFQLLSLNSSSLLVNTWTHIVVVRSGGVTSLFANGTRYATSSSSGTQAVDCTNFVWGAYNGNPALYNPNGYLTNLRMTNTAVYNPSSTTLTVPTTPLTPISGTKLLLSSNSGSYLADSSSSAVAFAQGNVSAAVPVWNQASPFATGLGYKNRVYTYTGSGTITF